MNSHAKNMPQKYQGYAVYIESSYPLAVGIVNKIIRIEDKNAKFIFSIFLNMNIECIITVILKWFSI